MGLFSKGGLVFIGGILVVVGFLLQSRLIEWLLDVMGLILIIVGIIVVVVGLVSLATGRKGGSSSY